MICKGIGIQGSERPADADNYATTDTPALYFESYSYFTIIPIEFYGFT